MDVNKSGEGFEIGQDICRLCLARDTRTLSIINTVLQNVYEKIADVKLNSIPKLQLVCYICHARLRQCYNLIQQAVLTEKLLKDAAVHGILLNSITKSQKCLTTSSVISISLDPSVAIEIKQEEKEDYLKIEDIKNEQDFNVLEQDGNSESDTENKSDLETRNNESQTDSEDDIPLRSIRLKVKKKIKINRDRIKKTKNTTIEKLEAKELLLDEKQQMAELLERSKSLNYLNSPYKCDLCYRGFRDPSAYSKHKDKHDLKSGRLECKICHLRYNTKQSLNSHTAAAHSRRFICTMCSHISLTKNQAVVHERWHNGHQYPCKLCDKRFIKPTSYLSHMRKAHSNLSEHVCHKCGESFAGRHGLLMHMSKSHKHDDTESEIVLDPTSNSYCKECGIQFLTLDAYNLHLLSSQKHKHAVWKENGSKCIICNTSISSYDHEKHARMHLKELKSKVTEDVEATPPTVQIPCTQCNKTFTSRSKLHMHVKRMHLGQRYNRNVVCEVCGKHCTSNATLRYHQRLHTGEKPYSCSLCVARFTSREHWRLHQRVHSGERPYSCGVCGHRFAQKPALNRHYIVHTGAKPYECHLCNKTFTQSASMKKHIQRVHLRQPPNRKKDGDQHIEKTNLAAL
ncbi:zinc finger protein 345-like isoform X1 [Maniola jurtina]|uniref:zinc finger protein 345-like isoform X1 n=1 Tax=Maniola jurtina TaxID=191418 RepID=UPI001E686C30|nr:zinc finger protein 345-like isoform X1 [Maniola jurtina]